MEYLTSVFGILEFAFQNPILSIAIFLAMLFGLLFVLTDGDPRPALAGLGRVAWSFVTTPFQFLIRSLKALADSDEKEQPYKDSRELVAYRALRFAYVAITIFSIAALSGGLAASLIAMYPKAELELRSNIKESLEVLEMDIEKNNAEIEEASRPGFVEALRSKATLAQKERDLNRREYRAVSRRGWSGGALNQVDNARSVGAVDEFTDNLETIIEDCNYRNGVDSCQELREVLLELARSKRRLIQAEDAFQEANSNVQNSGRALAVATTRAQALNEQKANLEEQFKEASLWNLKWLKPHFDIAKGLLFSTLLSVILFVWWSALGVEALSWLIMIMLALERRFDPGAVPDESDPRSQRFHE